MKHLRAFAEFWYDFIVGDDWVVAVGVVVAMAVVDLAARGGEHLWWLLPPAVTVALGHSLVRATRSSSSTRDETHERLDKPATQE